MADNNLYNMASTSHPYTPPTYKLAPGEELVSGIATRSMDWAHMYVHLIRTSNHGIHYHRFCQLLEAPDL